MLNDRHMIMIRLEGQRTDDERIYVTSPDLKGFHYLLEKDEDPLEAMSPVLKIFIERQLEKSLEEFRVPLTPDNYLKGKADPSAISHQVPECVITAVAWP